MEPQKKENKADAQNEAEMLRDVVLILFICLAGFLGAVAIFAAIFG